MKLRPILALVLGALLLMPGVALGEDRSAPSTESADPTASPTPAPGRRDLHLEMPSYLGGFEPQVVITRGEEHFAGLAVGDERRVELEGLLEAVDADIEDMVSGYALVSEEGLFAFLVALRIEGLEPGALLPAYLPTLEADLIDPSSAHGLVGGKDVLIISSVGSDDEYVDLFVYDQGDTIWMVQGPTDVVEITLENLPGPIASE